MRHSIRQHPWRLEIVPFLLIASCISVQTGYGSLGQNPMLPFMALCWIGQAFLNHNWVRSEQGQKRFNKGARNLLFPVGCFGLYGFEHATTWMLVAWFAVLPAAWFVQSRLEGSRRPLPRRTSPTPDIAPEPCAVSATDKLYYREMPPPWTGVSFTIAGGLLMMWMVKSVTTWWWAAVACFALFVLPTTVFFFRRAFVITNEKIMVRLGAQGISIPLASVSDCSIQDYNPVFTPDKFGASLKTYDGMRLFAWLIPPTSALVVEKCDGEKFLFTPTKPEKARDLIDAVLAARTKSEEKQ
jgi:hypothetical protein